MQNEYASNKDSRSQSTRDTLPDTPLLHCGDSVVNASQGFQHGRQHESWSETQTQASIQNTTRPLRKTPPRAPRAPPVGNATLPSTPTASANASVEPGPPLRCPSVTQLPRVREPRRKLHRVRGIRRVLRVERAIRS